VGDFLLWPEHHLRRGEQGADDAHDVHLVVDNGAHARIARAGLRLLDSRGGRGGKADQQGRGDCHAHHGASGSTR
jgi:hypothetical protein